MIVFFIFSALLTWLGVLSLRGGVRFRRYVRREAEKPVTDFTPFASVIAPCRGLDDGLAENLSALFRQNYPVYEIVFVVDDEGDAAVSVIREIMENPPANDSDARAKLVIAGRAVTSGQKVHNLRRAVREAAPESEIFAFVDSDARPAADWLRRLVTPLADAETGAATGYRWFISKRGNLASQIRAVWNASIASALGANTQGNFCWGGAMALRRETFESLDIAEKWRGALSDDFALTNALKAAELPIRFVPQCLTASVENCTFAELVEFTTRQMKITRVYSPAHWRASLIGSALFTIIFWANVLLVAFGAIFNQSIWLPLAFAAAIFALGAGKAFLRWQAVRLVLPAYRKELNTSLFGHLTLWTITPALFFYNSLCAAVSRRIRWRGIDYELKSPCETVIITDK